MMTTTRRYYVPALFLTVLAACEAPVQPPLDAGADGSVVAPPQCVVGGCSGQLCVSADIEPPITTCEFLPEYECYQTADCTTQPDGHCGWTLTADLMECLADAKDSDTAEPAPAPSGETTTEPEPPFDPDSECVTSGCSGQLCVAADSDPIFTTCEWREEYACYQAATCEKQADGACGWTATDELATCLDNAGAAPQ
jgi:eight-cysteine-cluster-containing protein